MTESSVTSEFLMLLFIIYYECNSSDYICYTVFTHLFEQTFLKELVNDIFDRDDVGIVMSNSESNIVISHGKIPVFITLGNL